MVGAFAFALLVNAWPPCDTSWPTPAVVWHAANSGTVPNSTAIVKAKRNNFDISGSSGTKCVPITHTLIIMDILAKLSLIQIKSKLIKPPLARLSAIDRDQGQLYLTFYNLTVYSFCFLRLWCFSFATNIFLHLAGHKDGEKITLGKELKTCNNNIKKCLIERICHNTRQEVGFVMRCLFICADLNLSACSGSFSKCSFRWLVWS